MLIDPNFEGVGGKPGLIIWRIENFEVKKIPDSEYGNFYSGDSYIVLKTSETKGGILSWDIHFWLGEETSQDESGTAAIKTVELDDALGGGPVQHREVQNFESPLFLSYFKKGIRYLKGGVNSGFHHVENVSVKRLLRVKGHRNVRLLEVPVDISSMNNCDCFVLDGESVVFVYSGPKSSRMERVRATQAANAIRDDLHCGRSEVKVIDRHSTESEISEFFVELGGGGPDDLSDETADDDDKSFELNFETKISLYKISEDETGELHVELISEKPLKQEFLQPDDCFLLDGGVNGIFVWIGKASSREERIGAMNLANKYIEKKGYPKSVQLKRIVEHGEPPLFKSYFSEWKEESSAANLGRYIALEQAAELDENPNKCLLFAKSSGHAPSFMPDDGTGRIEVYLAKSIAVQPCVDSKAGIFFSTESYTIDYKGTAGQRIMYYWLGKDSFPDDKNIAGLMAADFDRTIGGISAQIRVNQGEEPEHFLRMFKGKMVILIGGPTRGFKYNREIDIINVNETRLFQVKGTNDYNTRAEQVPETCSSLNSSDAFLITTPSKAFIWVGKDACNEELQMAKNLADFLAPDREIVEFNEGEESDEFWSLLGGKTEYSHTRDFPSKPLLQPRLFQISNASGAIKMEEICNFVQEDLCEDDVMVLDAGDAVYTWAGQRSNDEEKKGALKMTENYIRSDQTDRTPEKTVFIFIKQEGETESFRSCFKGWDDNLWLDRLETHGYR